MNDEVTRTDYEIVQKLFANIGRNVTIKHRELANSESYECEICHNVLFRECVMVYYNENFMYAAHLRCLHEVVVERAETIKEAGMTKKLFDENETEQNNKNAGTESNDAGRQN